MNNIQVQVISNSTTFYPVDSRNEDGLTLINSIAFLEENFKEGILSFSAEKQIVVLQMWNGLLFSISTSSNLSEELLRYILQIIRDTAVFLLGPHYENMMAKSIVASLRDIFSRYVEKYLNLFANDYKAALYLADYDIIDPKVTQMLKDSIKFDANNDESLIEVILFKNHKIAKRFPKNENRILETSDVFLISMFEQLEFPGDFKNESDIIIPEQNQIINKGAFIRIDGQPQQGLLSSVRFGSKSQFVAIFVFKGNQLTQENKERTYVQMSQVAQSLISSQITTAIRPTFQITGLLHYILINRTTGEFFDPHFITSSKGELEQKNLALMEKMKRRMVSIGMSSHINGYPSMIRNEMILQYTYDIIFINVKKQKEVTPKLFNAADFSEIGVSYKIATKNAFGDDSEIHCYELMTVYLGAMNTGDVIKANSQLFKELTEFKRKME